MAETTEVHSELDLLEQQLDQLGKLKTAVGQMESTREKADETVSAAQKIADNTVLAAQEVSDTNRLLSDASQKLIEQVKGVDLPERVSKMDALIVTINQTTQNQHSRLDSVERNLKDETQNGFANLASRLEKVETKVDSEFGNLMSRLERLETKVNDDIVALKNQVEKESTVLDRTVKRIGYTQVGLMCVLSISLLLLFWR